MAAKQYIWMNQPIGSLSELCHIEGATTTYGLTYCSSMVWISILFFLTTMKYYRSCEFELQITDILMYFGGSCLYGVQMFKWDKFYKWSRYLHLGTTCTGAACVSVCIYNYFPFDSLCSMLCPLHMIGCRPRIFCNRFPSKDHTYSLVDGFIYYTSSSESPPALYSSI